MTGDVSHGRLEAEEEKDDTEGHRREDLTGKDDVEGHRHGKREDLTGDDVEGHRHGKREDLTGDDDVAGHQAGRR